MQGEKDRESKGKEERFEKKGRERELLGYKVQRDEEGSFKRVPIRWKEAPTMIFFLLFHRGVSINSLVYILSFAPISRKREIVLFTPFSNVHISLSRLLPIE